MPHGIRVSTVNLSSSDPHGLARFYARLLDVPPPVGEDPTWAVLRAEPVALAFELDERYRPPVWPTREDQPPTQSHLEVQVDDLAGALEHALASGATLAAYQPQDDVRVCLDPAGHPFCLWVDPTGEDPAAAAPA